MRQFRFPWVFVAAATLALASCTPGGGTGGSGNGGGNPAPDGLIVALFPANVLVTFEAGSPRTLSDEHQVTGLAVGETLIAIDFRPSTGGLYALGLTSRLYQIDTSTGVATEVGAGPFAPALSGLAFDLELDPVADVARITSDADQNLTVDLTTGLVTAGTALDYDATDINFGADPLIAAAAYASNSSGVSAATLFAIDTGLDRLVRIGGAGGTPSADLGQIFTVGALGADVTSLAGFDITPLGGAFAALTTQGAPASELVRIDLT